MFPSYGKKYLLVAGRSSSRIANHFEALGREEEIAKELIF